MNVNAEKHDTQIHQRLNRCAVVRRLARGLGRLPLPWARWIVRVNGLRMSAHTPDRFLALWLWKWGRLEAAGLRCLRRYCAPGMRVADVGANVGVYTLGMARAVGPTGRVWAFEPDPGNAAALRRNVALNALENVEVVARAVGEKTAAGCLYLDEAHHGDHRIFPAGPVDRQIAVEVVALDDFFAGGTAPDVIKIDVQGAEQLVLNGMRLLLSAAPGPVLLLELSIGDPVAAGCSAEATVRDLESLGYAFACLDERSREPGPHVSGTELMAKIRAEEYVNVVAARPREEGAPPR